MIWIYEPSFATLPSPHSPQSSSTLLRRFLYTASDDMRTPLYDMSSSWLKYIATIENIPHSPMTSVIVGVVIDAHRTEYLFTRMRWRGAGLSRGEQTKRTSRIIQCKHMAGYWPIVFTIYCPSWAYSIYVHCFWSQMLKLLIVLWVCLMRNISAIQLVYKMFSVIE